ncbi:MAG: HEAT repeat domain-containing protein [Planctomycetota bacterium]|nr:HEAT repeat domain-containing protein [Planctomycetota bacterium]MDG2142630.1 HEAT repeat domain-containing protein [Planctomycetota bacterium]
MKLSARRNQLALIALSMLGASTSTAQESIAQDAPVLSDEPIADKNLQKDLERILYTRWGAPIRARSKMVDGAWQIRSGKDWQALPAGSITQHVLVRDIKREARARERKLKMALADDRADQAMWLIDQAMYPEALEHLEFCLRKDPDHAPALTLIGRNLLPMKTPRVDVTPETLAEHLPTALKPWFNSTAFMARASQEIAIRDLLSNLGDHDIRPTLAGELRHRTSKRRELAALILHRSDLSVDEESTVQALVRVAILDGSEDVRAECSRTLRDLKQEAITQPFVKALGSTSPAVRTNAAEALGTLGFVQAAAPLISALAATSSSAGSYRPPASHIFIGKQVAYIQDFDVEVAQGASIANPKVNVITEGAVLDVRLLSVRQEMVRLNERSALRSSLKSLLGKDFKYSADKWSKYLEEHPISE